MCLVKEKWRQVSLSCRRRGDRNMKNFIIVLLSITLLEILGLAYYNNLIATQKNTGINDATIIKEGETKPIDYEGFTRVSDTKIELASSTENRTYLAFTDAKNNVSVRDMNAGKVVYTKKEERKVIYLKWIRNDTLFIATEKIENGSKEIEIKTFTLSNQVERTIKTFTQISATSSVKTITFSEFTNDVYILIGNQNISRIYHFDTNGNMSSVESGGKYITDISVSTTDNTLYLEESKNGVYSVYKLVNQTYYLEKVESGARLLHVVDETLYIGNEDENNLITDIYTYEYDTLEKQQTLNEPVKKEFLFISSKGDVWTVNSVSTLNTTSGQRKSFSTPGMPRLFGNTVILRKSNTEYVLN